MINPSMVPRNAVVRMRLHYIDRCRALLMLLGIPYHAARLFSPGWGPPQGVTSRFCDVVAQAITEFRMPAFFLVAGFFAAMLLSRTKRSEWLRSRLMRLGLPLVTATILIIPVQLLIFSASDGGDATQVLTHWMQRLMEPSQIWISHLWFLDDLIIYSILVAASWPIVARLASENLPRVVKDSPFGTLFFLVGVVIAPLVIIAPMLETLPLGEMLNRLLHNGVFFLLGTILFMQPVVFERWLTWHWWRAAIAFAIIAATVLVAIDGLHYRPAMIAGAFAAVGGAWLVLAAMKRWGDAPSTGVKLLVDASLIIYLVHHPIILALGLVTAATSLPAELEWFVVTFTTFALSLGIYMVILRYPTLYFCFNGQRVPVARSALVTA